MAFPAAWNNYFFLGIMKKQTTPVEYEFGAIVDPSSLEISAGDNPFESIPNAAGGRVGKESPEEDGEISFDIWPVELDTATGVGLFQQFVGGTYDTVEPLSSVTVWTAGVARNRDLFKIAILWTNDTATNLTASGATTASTDSLRFYCIDARLVSMKESQGDGVKKATVTFKFPAYSKAGTRKNYGWESGDQTALVAFGATSSVWALGTTYSATAYPA